MNLGKKFEDNFRKSVPSNIFYYRFRDSGSTYYGGNNNLRFSTTNIADNMLFDGKFLYLNELKNHRGKSIPLSCINGNKTKEKQIIDLLEASYYDNVISSLIVFFSDVNECYSISIGQFIQYIEKTDKKSIPISFFQENGIPIEVEQLRTNQRFNIEKWINNI